MKTISKSGGVDYDDTGTQSFPARIDTWGMAIWRRGGENHREDGPAVFPASGKAVWFVDPKVPHDHPEGRTHARLKEAIRLIGKPGR